MLKELTHRTKAGLRNVLTFALLLAFVLCSTPSAFAQTITGTIQGTITASQANTKLAGVAVTAVAPSGRYTATTDSNGFFSMNGVTPDTYSVTFSRTGYETYSLSGVTVVQGQVANVSSALNQSLQRIGRTQARSTTGAFQPTQTTDQYNVGTAADRHDARQARRHQRSQPARLASPAPPSTPAVTPFCAAAVRRKKASNTKASITPTPSRTSS